MRFRAVVGQPLSKQLYAYGKHALGCGFKVVQKRGNVSQKIFLARGIETFALVSERVVGTKVRVFWENLFILKSL